MKFFYLILFFLAGCNTTMIDAVNYDDFRRQSLLKGFYFSAEAKSDNIKHLNDRGGYGSGVIQLRANQIALQSCAKAGFNDCIITKENNNNVRLTQWQQAEAKALELQNTELMKALELKNAEIKALELKNAEAKVLESKNTNDLLLQKYDIEPRDYEVRDYDKNQSAFFYVFRHDYIGYEIKAGKVWEPHLHQIFEKYITKNSVVLEGGCHVGTHSIKLSMLSKKLYCFEPLKESNSLLRKNIQRNDCSNTEVFNVALSDREGESYFAWMPLFNLGGSGLDDNPMGIPGSGDVQTTEQERYPVKTVTIDSLNLNELDFIKLDVEGYEPKVIEGALETIKKFRPVITLESWSNHFGQTDIEHTKKQFKMLLDLNYSVEQVGISDWLFLPL